MIIDDKAQKYLFTLLQVFFGKYEATLAWKRPKRDKKIL